MNRRQLIFHRQLSRLNLRINLIQSCVSKLTLVPSDIDLASLDRRLGETFSQFYYVDAALKSATMAHHQRMSFMDDMEKLRSDLRVILFLLGQSTGHFLKEDEQDIRNDLQYLAEFLIRDPSNGLSDAERKHIPGLTDDNGLIRRRSVRFLSSFCEKNVRIKENRFEILANLFTNQETKSTINLIKHPIYGVVCLKTRIHNTLNDKKRMFDILEKFSTLPHPHLASIYEAFVGEERSIIVLEYCDQVHSSYYLNALRQQQSCDESNLLKITVDILYQCSTALRFIHSKGFVHGSIQGRHLLIKNDGSARLAIPSYASIHHDYLYWSPERFLDAKEEPSAPDDIYAFALLTGELVSKGIVPFSSTLHIIQKENIKDVVIKGGRPIREYAHVVPQVLFAEMENWWDLETNRPDIIQIQCFLESYRSFLNILNQPSYSSMQVNQIDNIDQNTIYNMSENKLIKQHKQDNLNKNSERPVFIRPEEAPYFDQVQDDNYGTSEKSLSVHSNSKHPSDRSNATKQLDSSSVIISIQTKTISDHRYSIDSKDSESSDYLPSIAQNIGEQSSTSLSASTTTMQNFNNEEGSKEREICYTPNSRTENDKYIDSPHNPKHHAKKEFLAPKLKARTYILSMQSVDAFYEFSHLHAPGYETPVDQEHSAEAFPIPTSMKPQVEEAVNGEIDLSIEAKKLSEFARRDVGTLQLLDPSAQTPELPLSDSIHKSHEINLEICRYMVKEMMEWEQTLSKIMRNFSTILRHLYYKLVTKSADTSSKTRGSLTKKSIDFIFDSFDLIEEVAKVMYNELNSIYLKSEQPPYDDSFLFSLIDVFKNKASMIQHAYLTYIKGHELRLAEYKRLQNNEKAVMIWKSNSDKLDRLDMAVAIQKPITHVLNYHLFINRLLGKIPVPHPAYNGLSRVDEFVRELGSIVQKYQVQIENMKTFFELVNTMTKSPKKLIRGYNRHLVDYVNINFDDGIAGRLFVFSDMILLVDLVNGHDKPLTLNKVICRHSIPLQNILIPDVPVESYSGKSKKEIVLKFFYREENSASLEYANVMNINIKYKIQSLIDTIQALKRDHLRYYMDPTLIPLYKDGYTYITQMAFDPRVSSELFIERGHRVNLLKRYQESGWASGTNLNTGKTGFFPLICIATVREDAVMDVDVRKDFYSSTKNWSDGGPISVNRNDKFQILFWSPKDCKAYIMKTDKNSEGWAPFDVVSGYFHSLDMVIIRKTRQPVKPVGLIFVRKIYHETHALGYMIDSTSGVKIDISIKDLTRLQHVHPSSSRLSTVLMRKTIREDLEQYSKTLMNGDNAFIYTDIQVKPNERLFLLAQVTSFGKNENKSTSKSTNNNHHQNFALVWRGPSSQTIRGSHGGVQQGLIPISYLSTI